LHCTERKASHLTKGDYPGRLKESEIPDEEFHLFRDFVSEKNTSVSFPNRENLDCESDLPYNASPK